MDDPDLPLTAAERVLVDGAAAFARRALAPNVAAWERTRTPLPRTTVADWADAGLNRLLVATTHGGHGASYACKIRVAEALAASCFASAFTLNLIQGSVTRLEREGSADQIARWLPGLMAGRIVCAPALTEPGAGSDFAAIATHATKVPGGWRLTGEKAWVTYGSGADLLVLYAQTAPGEGAKGIASFLVDLHQPGVERLPPEPMLGGHAMGAAGFRFTDVRLEDAALFAPPGQAFKRALTGITGARIHVAAMACATVDASLAVAVRYAAKRQVFGQPVLDHQGVRWKLADVATGLAAARALTYRAARLYGQGQDAALAAAHAKKAAAELAAPAIGTCLQAMGAAGLRDDCPLGRHLATARIAAMVDGTTEIMTERIGAALARQYR